MERQGIPLGAKLGLAAGLLFVGGSTAFGVGTYRNEEEISRIKEQKSAITRNVALTEEEQTLLISTIPSADDANIMTGGFGLFAVAGGAVCAGAAIAQRSLETNGARDGGLTAAQL